jgi:hypothetical protein
MIWRKATSSPAVADASKPDRSRSAIRVTTSIPDRASESGFCPKSRQLSQERSSMTPTCAAARSRSRHCCPARGGDSLTAVPSPSRKISSRDASAMSSYVGAATMRTSCGGSAHALGADEGQPRRLRRSEHDGSSGEDADYRAVRNIACATRSSRHADLESRKCWRISWAVSADDRVRARMGPIDQLTDRVLPPALLPSAASGRQYRRP